MNVGYISRNVGIALVFNALFMFLSVGVSLLYGHDASFSPLLFSAIITLAVGIFPLLFVKSGEGGTIKEGYFTIVCSWLLSCCFGMLPYILWGGEFSVINAWFESVSGYTTTGSTILNDVESLPHGLLFWRTATHYIGGLGVVVFMFLIIPSSARSVSGLRVAEVELSSLTKANYRVKLSQTARIILIVYLALTIVQTFALYLAGMDFFDALNHSMSIASTGGFSTKSLSVASFNSPLIEVIMIFFMFLAGLHFGLIYNTFAQRSGKIFRSPVVKLYCGALVVMIAITTADLICSKVEVNFLTALRHSAFMNLSTATSTGFASTETLTWPKVAVMLLVIRCLVGACSGSTTGGIKVDRICVWFSSLRAKIKKQIHSNAVVRMNLGNQTLDRDLVADVNLFIVFYITIVLLCAVIFMATGMGGHDSLAASVACMGNTGLTFGTGGAFASYSAFPIFGKFIMTIEMLLGRLEIYPIITFVAINRWK